MESFSDEVWTLAEDFDIDHRRCVLADRCDYRKMRDFCNKKKVMLHLVYDYQT
mgnify:FL=1